MSNMKWNGYYFTPKAVAYSEPCQTSKMERFAKIVTAFGC